MSRRSRDDDVSTCVSYRLRHVDSGCRCADKFQVPSGETVYEKRGYSVCGIVDARVIAERWCRDSGLQDVAFGLPEVDDRFHVWRVPLLQRGSLRRVGEVTLDARSGVVDGSRSSSPGTVLKTLRQSDVRDVEVKDSTSSSRPARYEKGPTLRSVVHGDSRGALASLPPGSVDLVFTSPPYYNARPEYADYSSYDDYLEQVRAVIAESGRLLAEGRFFVMNVSPVLVRRENRSAASRRIAVSFDMHRLLSEEGFEFIDHIIWEKPSGAGWATGRGRRFAADRNPLQYKAVPVTEDILVYRKSSDRLIDWNIRTYPDADAVKRSRIGDDYERTNIWRLSPARDKRHPAVFPESLAERVIRYYSFESDTVLDPYCGVGTAGRVAAQLNRGFVMVERDSDYLDALVSDIEAGRWGALRRADVDIACTVDECAHEACGAGTSTG